MLQTAVNGFQWQVNNFSDLYPGNAAATTLTADASAHTKGADTAVLTGIAEDCYGFHIMLSAGATDVTIRRQMTDLLIDPAAGVGNAGSSWTPVINNLYTNSPSTGSGCIGHNFFFPVFLKAGTAIGARIQDVVGAATSLFSIRIFGKPTHPELLKVGTKVQTIGATAASTTGVAVTPGNGAVGSYSASLGTLTDPAWWWQLGIGSADTTMSTRQYWFDIAHDATSKYLCLQQMIYQVPAVSGLEASGKEAFGVRPPIQYAAAGQDVYVRGSATGAPDSSMTAVVYAVS